MKKAMQVIIPILAALLAVLGYSRLAGVEGVAFKFDVVYDGNMEVLWAALDAFPDGTVVKITFKSDGAEFPHVPKMQLMGGSDASFDIGDLLPLSKSDGVWHEMTRYVKP